MEERKASGTSLWDRITNDPEFIKRKHEIQARYGLPLKYDIRLNHREWTRWTGEAEKAPGKNTKRGRAFLSDVHTLFKKFEIPESWHYDLIAEIAGSSYLDEWNSPKFETYKDSEGNWKWQCIITPETDLTNPKNLDIIKEQQKVWAGDPPKPVRESTNSRKLDWRPVHEWYKRHPLFTLEEIAEKIGYPKDKVKLKIAELEAKK